MAKITKDGKWVNRNGKPVDPKAIPTHIKRRDKLVTDIVKLADDLQKYQENIRSRMDGKLQAFAKWTLDRKKVKDVEIEGNLQLSDYAGMNQVSYTVHTGFDFDERLNIAIPLIRECINEWVAEGVNRNLKVIVEDALRLDKHGNYNKAKIWSLTQTPITHKKWNQAMELIKESYHPTESRRHFRVSKREDIKGKFKPVNLDFSKLENR